MIFWRLGGLDTGRGYLPWLDANFMSSSSITRSDGQD